MYNKIKWTLIIFIMALLTFGAWDIRQNNIISISKGYALSLSDISDAFTGHYNDLKDRLKEDAIIEGEVVKTSTADWSSDSIHYVDGSVSIINKDGQMYVQLNKDFSAGLAPDLYIYLAPGHITSDAQFINNQKMELGKLVKGSGASFYEIPKILNSYSDKKFSVVIHCKRFNEPMGSFHFN